MTVKGSGHITDDATYEIIQAWAIKENEAIMMYIDVSANQEDQQYRRFWESIQAQAKISEGRGMMEELESLIQASQDEWQAYQDEHLATGDGAPRPETAETGVKARFRELLWQHPELTRLQAYMQAVMEVSNQTIAKAAEETEGNNDITVKVRMGNLDGWRYCTMKVTSDDDEPARCS